jgi:hypothetical protein
MATTDTLSRFSPYAERLLDDYIYDELDDAGKKLRAAYGRVRRRKAVDDPHLVRLVRSAGDSLRNAAVAVTGQPEPPSRKPRILAALAITGVTAWFVKRLATGTAESGAR